MTLQTNPAERREVVRAISERLGSRRSTCACRPAPTGSATLTVERDGSIASDDGALLDGLRPMLMERGWLTDAADSEVEAPAAKTELGFPVEDWTVSQLTNLLRILYSHQYILRRMMRSDTLYIDRQLVERLKEAQTPGRFRSPARGGPCGGNDEGLPLSGRASSPSRRTRTTSTWSAQQAYGALLGAILRQAKDAKRVFLKADADSENEKYRANSLLTRLGFGGPGAQGAAARAHGSP